MDKKKYENGNNGTNLDIKGVGYVYYPNGAIAICSSPASDYQNRFYAFDKDRKTTVLLGVDELGIGFASCSKRKSAAVENKQCVLSKIGGLISHDGNITHEWRWDGKTTGPPDSFISIDLNENLTFKLKNRQEMFLSFRCENITVELDMGVKQKRETSYLDNATKQIDGKIIPKIDHVTLQERTRKFNADMSGQRNKLYPKSENLTDMVSGIVKNLENNFEHISEKLLSSTSAGTEWKSESLSATIKEIPKITVSGTEIGSYFGLGEKIYTSEHINNLAMTV